jgi:lysozyme family protein
MANFEQVIPKILVYEGGYVNDPDDPGGETNRGIIDRLDGITDGMIDIDGDGIGDVRVIDLTEEQAKQIYKRVFWDQMKGDQFLSTDLAAIVFDAYVNTGRIALKQLQRIVGVKDDGVIGPETLAKVNGSNLIKTFSMYRLIRKQYYKDLVIRKPRLNKFLKGWLNRVDKFKLTV